MVYVYDLDWAKRTDVSGEFCGKIGCRRKHKPRDDCERTHRPRRVKSRHHIHQAANDAGRQGAGNIGTLGTKLFARPCGLDHRTFRASLSLASSAEVGPPRPFSGNVVMNHG
ncbi:hypothetical protein D9M68_502100 [compost metagenome]